jgi:hypothetical protein
MSGSCKWKQQIKVSIQAKTPNQPHTGLGPKIFSSESGRKNKKKIFFSTEKFLSDSLETVSQHFNNKNNPYDT